MIYFKVGDMLKSSEYDFLDGAKIIRTDIENIYVLKKTGRNDTYSKTTLSYEIKAKNITLISGKITNWKERILWK